MHCDIPSPDLPIGQIWNQRKVLVRFLTLPPRRLSLPVPVIEYVLVLPTLHHEKTGFPYAAEGQHRCLFPACSFRKLVLADRPIESDTAISQ